MSPEGGVGFRSCGGEVLTGAGRPVPSDQGVELLDFYAALARETADPKVRCYLIGRRTELADALDQAGLWRRASAAPSGGSRQEPA